MVRLIPALPHGGSLNASTTTQSGHLKQNHLNQ